MSRDRDQARQAKAARAEARTRARRDRMITRLRWGLLVVGGVALIGFVLFRSSSGDVSVDGFAALGAPAPDVEMTDFEGQTFTLDSYEGTPLVLNFWASWCPNCIAEMPDFERVSQAVGNRVEFLGVNQRDRHGAAVDLAGKTKVTYRLARDPQGRVFDAFGGAGMPTTVFIDADGNVVDVVTGQLSAELLAQRIEQSFGVTVDA